MYGNSHCNWGSTTFGTEGNDSGYGAQQLGPSFEAANHWQTRLNSDGTLNTTASGNYPQSLPFPPQRQTSQNGRPASWALPFQSELPDPQGRVTGASVPEYLWSGPQYATAPTQEQYCPSLADSSTSRSATPKPASGGQLSDLVSKYSAFLQDEVKHFFQNPTQICSTRNFRDELAALRAAATQKVESIRQDFETFTGQLDREVSAQRSSAGTAVTIDTGRGGPMNQLDELITMKGKVARILQQGAAMSEALHGNLDAGGPRDPASLDQSQSSSEGEIRGQAVWDNALAGGNS